MTLTVLDVVVVAVVALAVSLAVAPLAWNLHRRLWAERRHRRSLERRGVRVVKPGEQYPGRRHRTGG